MRAELPAISFLCVAALVLVAPVFASSRNIPVLSLAAWLLCCNVIHGVNTLVWAGNDAIHVPAWCDIGIPRFQGFRTAWELLTDDPR